MQKEKVKMFTTEQINDIINIKDINGKQIDIFNLHGVLFVGNAQNGIWDLTRDGHYTMYCEHSLPISLEDFDGCESDEDVLDAYFDALVRSMREKMV